MEPDARDQLETRLTSLLNCCGIEAVVLLQRQSLSGDIRQDLDLLRDQIRRADLDTPLSVLLIYQFDPPAAIALRAPGLAAEMTPTLTEQI